MSLALVLDPEETAQLVKAHSNTSISLESQIDYTQISLTKQETCVVVSQLKVLTLSYWNNNK